MSASAGQGINGRKVMKGQPNSREELHIGNLDSRQLRFVMMHAPGRATVRMIRRFRRRFIIAHPELDGIPFRSMRRIIMSVHDRRSKEKRLEQMRRDKQKRLSKVIPPWKRPRIEALVAFGEDTDCQRILAQSVQFHRPNSRPVPSTAGR